MSDEKSTIERAIRDEGTITRAARALGASRRTLQARMRRVGLPPGQAGRPRKRLRRRASVARVVSYGVPIVGVVALVGVAALAFRKPRNA